MYIWFSSTEGLAFHAHAIGIVLKVVFLLKRQVELNLSLIYNQNWMT